MPIYPESDYLKWPSDNFPTIDLNIRRENGNKEKVIKLKFKNEYLKEKKNPTKKKKKNTYSVSKCHI